MKILAILILISVNLQAQKIYPNRLPRTTVKGVEIEWSDGHPITKKYTEIRIFAIGNNCDKKVTRQINEIVKANPGYRFIRYSGEAWTYEYKEKNPYIRIPNYYIATLGYKIKK